LTSRKEKPFTTKDTKSHEGKINDFLRVLGGEWL
jgi:hypothetical protein